MLNEVGFWCDTHALRRSESAPVNERSSLLQHFNVGASFSSSPARALQKDTRSPTDDKQDADDPAATRLDPTQLVDRRWFVMNAQCVKMLEWYLTDGACVESHELAYSYCRFGNCPAATKDPKILGACTLTDGVYVWPEGYVHYILYHHVRPPEPFIDHVTTNYRRALIASRALSREFGDDVLWLWDPQSRQPVPMPSGMQQWILTNTTLRVPSDSTKHTTPIVHRRQPWDCLASRLLPDCCGCCIS